MSKPLLFVILDGMTEEDTRRDAPFAPPGCACMERMAKEGGWGFLDNTPPGLPVDSLTCIATLLGVPAGQVPRGRAYLEALSAGIAVGAEDAVCRCNLTALAPDGTIIGAAQEQDSGELARLFRRLGKSGIELFHLSGYRNLLVLRGEAKQARAMLQEPGCGLHAPHEHLGEDALTLLPPAAPDAVAAVAEKIRSLAMESRFTLGNETHMLFPWDLSVRQELPSFAALHTGLEVACVCRTEIVRGLCKAMGIAVVSPPGTTADADTSLAAKADAALELVQKRGLVLVHVNGADELGHRCDAAGKAAFLRRADEELLKPLCAKLPQGGRLLVCSDHGTSAKTGGHVGGVQPFLLYEQGGGAKGQMGLYPGNQAVELLAGWLKTEGK